MTVVSSKDFAANQEKYFDLALDEQNDMNIYHEASVYEEVLEPDDDLRSAISADEFKKRALEIVEKVHNMYYLAKWT